MVLKILVVISVIQHITIWVLLCQWMIMVCKKCKQTIDNILIPKEYWCKCPNKNEGNIFIGY